ncbi:sensor histidine kinase [Dongia sp.]|uniref:sensor histidine kinase n=1 Tax=Dongia sp. TaxID=1977262 RepID=UPI0035B29FAD
MLRPPIDRRLFSPLNITLAVMLVGLIGCIVTSGLLFEKRKHMVESITASGSENFTWAFNQLRVEFYRLQALSEGVDDRRDSLAGKEWEPALRKRYEIFVSRVNTVDIGSYRGIMMAEKVYVSSMSSLTALVRQMDEVLGGPNGFNIDAVEIYLRRSREIAPEIDELTAKAVEVDSRRLGSMRDLLVTQEHFERINLIFQLIILIAFAALAFYGLYRQERQKRHLVKVATELRQARIRFEREEEAKLEALQRALVEEQRNSQMQRRFVSMASHEFRTPLAIIDSTAQRMLRKLDRMTPEDITDRVNRIRQTVGRMGELIETMLEAGRSQEGRTEFNPSQIDVGAVIRHTVKRQRDITRDHIIVDEYEALPALCQGDARLLDHIMVNLLANAVKYSPKDSEIFVRAVGENGEIRISVTDNGVGIPADEIKHIGETFFRASTSAGIPGTGVGLNLVKKFVALHGGSLEINSRVGIGTTFTVRLPIVAAGDAAAA